MHAVSLNLQAGFAILQKSRCWSPFVCLTSSINEVMCVQLLVKLSLDCVHSELERSDTAAQTGNPVISSLLSLPSEAKETSQMWHGLSPSVNTFLVVTLESVGLVQHQVAS